MDHHHRKALKVAISGGLGTAISAVAWAHIWQPLAYLILAGGLFITAVRVLLAWNE